jgi:hypothetical protein
MHDHAAGGWPAGRVVIVVAGAGGLTLTTMRLATSTVDSAA